MQKMSKFKLEGGVRGGGNGEIEGDTPFELLVTL